MQRSSCVIKVVKVSLSILASLAFSTPALWCRDFHSRVFHPWIMVPCFPLPRFPPPVFLTLSRFPLPRFQSPQCAMHSPVGTLQWAGTRLLKMSLSGGGSGPHLTHDSFYPYESAPTRHLNWFSRFCTAHPCVPHSDRHTDTQTTLRATSVAYVQAMRPNNTDRERVIWKVL